MKHFVCLLAYLLIILCHFFILFADLYVYVCKVCNVLIDIYSRADITYFFNIQNLILLIIVLIELTTLAGTYLANNVFIDYTLVASPPHTQHK